MKTIHIIMAVVLVLILVLVGYGIYSATVDSAGDSLKDSKEKFFGEDDEMLFDTGGKELWLSERRGKV